MDSRAFRGRCPPPVLDPQVFACPPQIPQLLLESVHRALPVPLALVQPQFDGAQTFTITLLPERRHRPRQRGKTAPAEKIAWPHSRLLQMTAQGHSINQIPALK